MNIDLKIEIEWCRPSDLAVDPDCQRTFDERSAKRMARAWNDAEFLASLPLNGSTRGDSDTVFLSDGQHRIAALLMRGDNDPIPVAVVHRVSKHHQAEQFLSLNGGRKPSKTNAHRIALVAEHEDAIEVDAILSSRGQSKIEAIDTCYRVYQIHGPANLWTTLGVLSTAFGKDRRGYNSQLLRAVAAAVASPGVDLQRLETTLMTLPPLRWKQESISKGGLYKAIAERYNRRLTKGRLA